MIAGSAYGRRKHSRPIRGFVGSWQLWRVNRRALGYLLATEALAVLLVFLSPQDNSISTDSWVRLATLFGLAAVYGEACDRLERLRWYLSAEGVVSNHNSVLCFAGVLLLPVRLAALLVVAVYCHRYLRERRHHSTRMYRLVFTAAAVLIATVAAAGVYHGLNGQLTDVGPVDALVVLAALLVHIVADLAVLAPGMYLVVRPAAFRLALPPVQDIGYEAATLVLGVLSAVVLQRAAWLSPLILVVVAVWQRASLVTKLQHTAQHDSKTGLLQAAAWRELAARHLVTAARTLRPVSLLVIDLDRFKEINDTYGHLAGDKTLLAVADVLRKELRTDDAISRYGGEEFVALLPDLDQTSAAVVADRVRARIAAIAATGPLRVTASIGVSTASSGAALDSLIEAADAAMYAAKAAGRDRIHVHAEDATAANGAVELMVAAAALDPAEPDATGDPAGCEPADTQPTPVLAEPAA